MKKSTELQIMREWVKNLTKEEAQRIVREVLGPPTRNITGEEYEKIMTMLRLAEPISVTNNQFTETEEYLIGDTKYHVTYFADGVPELIELLKEENE